MADEIRTDDTAYGINAAVVDAIMAAVELESRERLTRLLEPLHAADIADLLEQLAPQDRIRLLHTWGHEIDGEVLAELTEGARDHIIEALSPEILAKAVQDLDTDDVVYLVEDLEEAQQEAVLETLDEADRIAVEQSLTFPDYSAGRMMQRELVLAPTHWTVGDIIDYMRNEEDLPERFYDVFIVDPRIHPVGRVPLGSIMANRRDVRLSTLMDEDFRSLSAYQTQEDVAHLFNKYHLVSAPVTDDNGRIVGMITIDDAMLVLQEEAQEDMNRLVGLGDAELSDGIWETLRLRFPWLAINLATAVLASFVIAIFEDTIAVIVALAVLMPIVASMGGNAATQSLTVAVRGLATKDLTANNAMRVVRREAIVGLANGAAFAVLMGIVAKIWFGSALLGVVIGVAMIINLLVAGLAGTLIPILLDRMKLDPALASGTFVTTVTDVVGFFVFLGLAGAVLL